MQNGHITDAQIASSSYTNPWFARNARLFSTINSWKTYPNNTDQWIGVDLYRQTQVTGVVLQGDFGNNWWVKTYKVAYSLDNDDRHFEFVKDESGNPEVRIQIYFAL